MPATTGASLRHMTRTSPPPPVPPKLNRYGSMAPIFADPYAVTQRGRIASLSSPTRRSNPVRYFLSGHRPTKWLPPFPPIGSGIAYAWAWAGRAMIIAEARSAAALVNFNTIALIWYWATEIEGNHALVDTRRACFIVFRGKVTSPSSPHRPRSVT